MSNPDSIDYFDGDFDVLQIKKDASVIDIADMMGHRISQLDSMLGVVCSNESIKNDTEKEHRSNHFSLFLRTVREVESLGLELLDRHLNG